MKNKKANIPITILVMGTIAVCIIALIAFYNMGKKNEVNVQAFKYVEVMNNIQNDIAYYNGQGVPVPDLLELYLSAHWVKGDPRNYYPIVKKIKEEGNFLILEEKDGDEVLIKIKVPK